MEFAIAMMSDSLHFLLQAAQDTLRFDYMAGNVTAIEYPHSTGWRTLPHAVLVQVVGAEVTVENAQGAIQLVKDREAFCLSPDMKHKVDQVTNLPGVSRWSHVNFSLFGATSLFAVLDIPLHFSGEAAQWIGDINETLAVLESTDNPTFAQICQKMALGFQLASILSTGSSLSVSDSAELRFAQLLAPVLVYIDEHLDQPCSRETLAQLIHLSPSRFYTIFKKMLGIPPNVYVQNARLRKAQILLLRTNLSVHAIARRVGYEDVFYFSRFFKKQYGLSPSHYRTSIQGT